MKFETGKTYTATSAGDSDCHWVFTVVRRTAKTVWIQDNEELAAGPVARRVHTCSEGKEFVRPFGVYSMSPVLSSSRLALDIEPAPAVYFTRK